MTKRGKLEVMRDILKIIQESRNFIRPTPLLRKSKLSSVRFKEYFLELVEKDLVKEINDKKGDKFVILTEKGFKFLDKYKTIISFIEEFEL
jgi:predicted transcriptional regulator